MHIPYPVERQMQSQQRHERVSRKVKTSQREVSQSAQVRSDRLLQQEVITNPKYTRTGLSRQIGLIKQGPVNMLTELCNKKPCHPY